MVGPRWAATGVVVGARPYCSVLKQQHIRQCHCPRMCRGGVGKEMTWWWKGRESPWPSHHQHHLVSVPVSLFLCGGGGGGGSRATRGGAVRATAPSGGEDGREEEVPGADANADADDRTTTTTTIPIFPLGIVALPAAQCPLHIFEARYRVLFSTLLAGSQGIDQGLVSPEKPWKGTRRFGMAYYDQQAGGLASVGTVLEIQDHSSMEDGRMLIENVGKERFKILQVVEEKPVLVCKIEYITEDDDSEDTIVKLGQEVASLFKDVIKLSTKLKEAEVEPEVLEPKELESLGPRDLSFWVASLFAGNPYNQQALLEENSTEKRLSVEKELLENTLKYLSAQSALQSAFGGEGESPLSGDS